MSNGKIAAIIVSVVVGLFIILGIIVGVVACNIVNVVKDITEKDGREIVNSIISEVEDYTLPDWIEDTTAPETSATESEDTYTLGMLDEDSHCYYKETEGGVTITGYDSPFEYESNLYTVNVPSEINGKDVVEITSMGIYNYSGNDDLYIKVVIPGSVKVIGEYAFAFNDDINEVVIEDGVETIEAYAFYDCEDLEKATVAKSVTAMDDCGLGIEFDDDTYDDVAIEDFVLYGTKGSAAESYAKDNNLKFAEAK